MPSGTISLDQPSPNLGDTITFTYTAEGLHGQESPRVQVDAYQEVPFEYTDPNGGTHTQEDPRVYSEGRPAGVAFDPLGGGGSVWLWHGGPAHCVATLYYWGKVQGQQTFVPLATVEFDAGG